MTGVSGSGKSSLVNEILYKHLAKSLNRARCIAGDHDDITGIEQLDKVIDIDQSPIGRTPRSNPATYTGVFDMIRDLFASTTDAKERGYNKGRFSFNVKGDDVKPVPVMVLSKLRCISCRMYTYRVKCVEENAITEKLWKLSIRERAYMTYLI